jgi:signal transduction histidine kinase
MSFKYRFILSFVLLEIVFILLIVTMNFIAITNSSNKLIENKIESNLVFLDRLLKIPVSIYDLATLDEIVESTNSLDFINSIVVLDSQDNVLSKKYNYKNKEFEEFLEQKQNENIELTDSSFKLRYKELQEDGTKIGSIYLVYDVSENAQFINKNKTNTILVILFEILISTFLSYFIGKRITQRLEKLAGTARLIGENKEVVIDYQDTKDEIGELSRAMHQMREDIKERREKLKGITEELRLQKRELITANQAKDDFLANMSHELKTPLNSINLISSVMMKNKQNKLDAEQVKNLRIINSSGNDLLYLINDILDISKIEAGQLDIISERFVLKDLMDSIVEMFEPLVLNKNLQLEYKMDTSIGTIRSDSQRIKQIVKNLLSNSLKFTRKGKIRLIVKEQNSIIRILVQDDGVGIPSEKLENIFDRFKQADSSTTRKFGGTGLGLSICKELSNLLGGDIQVKSKTNIGSAFLVTIKKELDIENTKKEKTNNDLIKEPTMSNDLEDIDMELFEETKEEIVDESPKVVLLNNNPSLFFPLIVALKKLDEIEFVQVNDKTKLEDEIKLLGANLFIFDGDIYEEDIETIIKNHSFNTIAIADENRYENISSVIPKPLSVEDITNIILKKV